MKNNESISIKYLEQNLPHSYIYIYIHIYVDIYTYMRGEGWGRESKLPRRVSTDYLMTTLPIEGREFMFGYTRTIHMYPR